MITSTVPPTLAELRQLSQDIVNEQKAAGQKTTEQKNALVDELRAALQRYLADRLGESGNRVTEDILREVDSIYDVPGIPSALAAYLGYERVYDLQEALGRTVERACARCKNPFEIVESRKVGGYKTVYEQHCPRCRRIVREHGKLLRQDEILHAQRNTMRAVDVDALLRKTADPTALPHYRAKILAFLRFWQSGKWQKSADSFTYTPRVVGCMICGSKEAQPCVTRRIQIPNDSIFAHLMRQAQIDPLPRAAVKFGHHYEQLESFHQALWRLPPATYFNYFPEYPLLDRPLLMLCDACGTTIEATHQHCDVSNVREPLELITDSPEMW